ncbi:DNA-binding barrel domain superfamily [Sesbania bispinosa]|nr:DNA-binding barrel domain superfamily [Sesbania bispinosa]
MFEHTAEHAEYLRQRSESFTANMRSTQWTIIIHREFFEHWIDQILDKDIKLTDPVGNVHTLRVRKHEKIGFFREGVTEMIKFYGLEGRHSIQFTYNDNRRFDIQIMDSESKEIQYPILLNQPHVVVVPPFVVVVPPPPGYMVPPPAAIVPPPPGYMVPPPAAVVPPPAAIVPPPPAAIVPPPPGYMVPPPAGVVPAPPAVEVHFPGNAAANEHHPHNENLQEDVVGWDFIATPPFISGRKPLHIPAHVVSIMALSNQRWLDLINDAGVRVHASILTKNKRRKNERYLGKGWYEFCRDLNIQVGDVVCFRFFGNSYELRVSV